MDESEVLTLAKAIAKSFSVRVEKVRFVAEKLPSGLGLPFFEGCEDCWRVCLVENPAIPIDIGGIIIYVNGKTNQALLRQV